MGPFEQLLIGLSLAMDSFAISVCKGSAIRDVRMRHALAMGLCFGFAQAAMPLLGYLLSRNLSGLIHAVDHWISFALLLVLGGNMIREARGRKSAGHCRAVSSSLEVWVLLALAIVTSIDAFTIGMTMAFLEADIVTGAVLFGVVTFLLCFAGAWIGTKVGDRFGANAEMLGGCALIAIGVKIILEHMGWI